MTKKKKHTKKKRQQPKTKKQKVMAKQSINGFNLFETQMRAMGKRLLEVFKDKDTVNATLREHIETIEGYFRKYDSVQLLGSIGLYLLDNLPNLEKYFMAQMNGTEMHLDENAEVIAEYAMNFGLSMPNDGIDNPTDEVVKDLRNRLRALFMTYIYQDMPLVDDPMQSIDWMIHMDTIAVRGDGYQNHVYEVFKEMFFPHTTFYQQQFGYSVDQPQAASLCRSLLTPAERYEEAYFEAVRTLLLRLTGNKKITRKIIDERITQLLKVAIKADGVVEILSTKGTEISLFDENFLKEIAEMKEKNFALELLKRLLEEHIRKHAKKRMVEAEKFSEMLDARLAEYLRGLISNEEVIKELLKMAQELKANAEQASELGLTEEEQAFYDALTKPQAVRDFYENDQLVAMAKELTEALRSSKTIDWRQKESARAKMRSMVKRLLKKYKYPPEEQEAALETVIRQCELYADSDDN